MGYETYARMAQRGRTDLLASAAAGDEVAFRRIIANHHEDVCRVRMVVPASWSVAMPAS
jgi:hypothetical protein